MKKIGLSLLATALLAACASQQPATTTGATATQAQTQQGAGHQHHQHGKTRDADCFLSQRRIKALRDVNEKGNAGQGIHQCEQGHQGLEGKKLYGRPGKHTSKKKNGRDTG